MEGRRTVEGTIPFCLTPHDATEDSIRVPFQFIEAMANRVNPAVRHMSVEEDEQIPVGIGFGVTTGAGAVEDDLRGWLDGMNGLTDTAEQRRLLLGECPRRHINHPLIQVTNIIYCVIQRRDLIGVPNSPRLRFTTRKHERSFYIYPLRFIVTWRYCPIRVYIEGYHASATGD
jgi:hypothetical protein